MTKTVIFYLICTFSFIMVYSMIFCYGRTNRMVTCLSVIAHLKCFLDTFYYVSTIYTSFIYPFHSFQIQWIALGNQLKIETLSYIFFESCFAKLLNAWYEMSDMREKKHNNLVQRHMLIHFIIVLKIMPKDAKRCQKMPKDA